MCRMRGVYAWWGVRWLKILYLGRLSIVRISTKDIARQLPKAAQAL